MPKYETPAREGNFWAKQKIMSAPDDFLAREGFHPMDIWEPVEVFHNGGAPGNPEEYMVFVPGLSHAQPTENFFWGPEIMLPEELR